jgi:hypothetical protein
MSIFDFYGCSIRVLYLCVLVVGMMAEHVACEKVKEALAQETTVTKNNGHVDTGVSQYVDVTGYRELTQKEVQDRIRDTQLYVKEQVIGVLTPEQIERCKDLHEMCTIWRYVLFFFQSVVVVVYSTCQIVCRHMDIRGCIRID